MVAQPSGTVTFLFTDIEGSIRLWEQYPEQMPASLARHDAILRTAIESCGGYIFKTVGDAFCAAFDSSQDAMRAAVSAQRAIETESWPGPAIRVRMALHTGSAEERDGDYFGQTVNEVARLMAAGHGGQLLVSGVSRGLVVDHLPDGASLADRGEHRLKDIGQPVHIYQLDVAGLQTDFPALDTLSAQLTNIPVQATPFVGRRAEIADLRDLLSREDVRLVTLTGPGGIGKTRLAVHLADQLVGAYRDGVFFVPLAPLESAGQIVQAIVEALGISFSSGGNLKRLLLRYLRRRRMLLLFDNFEHLLDGAPLVAELLQAGPDITLLATTREKLNLRGETVYNVSGLGYADWHTPAELLAHSAGRLFVQSARQAHPAFELHPDHVGPIAQICRLVQGVPLGILLAAAWVDMLSPGEIAAEIGRSLDFLETDMRDVPARQRSIRAVFETSWERLSPAERELFSRLSVFRGGFTWPAAQQVAGASLRTLAGLLDKSFLRRDPDTGRYEVHELLRQYAAERLKTAPEAGLAVRDAHAAFFADFMAAMLPVMRSSRQKAALDEIEADVENVRSAWRHLAARGRAAGMSRIVDSLWYFHEIRGWYHAGIDLFAGAEQALAPASSGEPHQVITAQLRAIQGFFTAILGSPRPGLALIDPGLTTLRQLDRSPERLVPLLGAMVCNIFTNRGSEALQAAQEAQEIVLKLGDDWWQAEGFTALASASMAARAVEDARYFALEATGRWARIGDAWGSLWPAQVLAGLATADGDYAEAKGHYLFALESAMAVNFRRGLQINYHNLANVSYQLKDYAEAELYCLFSLGISEELGQTREILAALNDIARVWHAMGDSAGALELLAAVLQDPASSQHALFQQATIQEEAEALRAAIAGRLSKAGYAEAWNRGRSRDLHTVVDELLTSSSG